MRITKLLLICLYCVLIVPALWGQAAANNSAKLPGILGYLDPQTGAFRPVPATVDDSAEPPVLTTFTGTITVTLTITLKTAGITTVSCSANVSVPDATSTITPRFYNELANATGTNSGTTRTCKLTIHYAWGLQTQASDTMTTSYSVAGATVTVPLARLSTLTPLDARKVPSSGTTTALTSSVTL